MEFVQRSRNYALNESIDTTNEYAHVKRLTVILQMCVIIIEINNILTDEQILEMDLYIKLQDITARPEFQKSLGFCSGCCESAYCKSLQVHILQVAASIGDYKEQQWIISYISNVDDKCKI